MLIEVGAYHPLTFSNSLHFEEHGWNTYQIEPCPAAPFSNRKNGVIQVAVSHTNSDNIEFKSVLSSWGAGKSPWTASFSALELDPRLQAKFAGVPQVVESTVRVSVRTLDSLLATDIHETRIDVLSIDVEGEELGVLQGIDLTKWRPKVILVENHFYDEGTSAIHQHLLSNKYRLDKHLEHDYFYVPA